MKENRIKMLIECMLIIQELQKSYTPASPGWILLQAAYGHVKSLHHLEDETVFDEEILGVKRETTN